MKELLLKNKRQFGKYILGALLTVTLNLISTFALSHVFGILNADSQEAVIGVLLTSLGLFLLPPLLFMASRGLRIGFMRDIVVEVREASFAKLMRLDIQTYNTQPREVYLSRMVSDLTLFEKDFFLSILNIISSAGTFIIGIVILWVFISPILAVATIGVAGVLYGISMAYEKPVREAQKNKQEANVEYNLELSNVLNGLEVMKLYNVEKPFLILSKNIVGTVESIKNRYQRLNGIQEALTQGIAGAFQVLAIVYATYLWLSGQVSMESMILVFSLMGQLVWSFVSMTAFINRLKASFDVYHRLTDVDDAKCRGTHSFTAFNGMQIEGLGYQYGDHKVFENLSFSVEPKSKVLIHGPSGVGKTTLLNCLAQTLGDYEGAVNVNQIHLRDISHTDYLKNVGYVRQNHFMFEDSIRNNITLGRPFDAEKLRSVLESVDLVNWIDSLELGWDHPLEQNGSNISGGQKQRLSLARELYRDCDILFVDEPSASLDDETARFVYDALLSLDRTVVCVSHRHLNYLKDRFDTVIDLERVAQ